MVTFEGLEFQELESQSVREYWEDEAREFTPWLANEIQSGETSYLEDVLGLDLEVIEIEKSVGKYSVDIFALLNSDLISRYHLLRRMKPRNSILSYGNRSPRLRSEE